MEYKDGIQTFYAKSRDEWRKWLQKNHQSEKSVWLIIYKKGCSIPSVYYPEAVDEALCFGWIDSKPNKRDAESYYQFFSKRNPKSNWSKVNKNKVAVLLKQGLISKAGLESIEIAKQNGAWSALDEVENIVLPLELKELFQKNEIAFLNWEKFPRSTKRGILEWIFNAKRSETKTKRIIQTVEMAKENKKANYPVK